MHVASNSVLNISFTEIFEIKARKGKLSKNIDFLQLACNVNSVFSITSNMTCWQCEHINFFYTTRLEFFLFNIMVDFQIK